MAIYPKSNKKRIKKYYPGGRMPQGAADSPLVGIGLQYRETAGEAPNLQAAQYLDASLRQSDAKHEEEYKKKLFDRKAYNAELQKIIGTAGAKGKLSQDFNSALDRYEDKTREDIDFVWTDEGRKMAKEIENVLDPGKIEGMKANYADITTQYEQSLKAGTLNQNHVVNGMASVIDKDGTIKKVHASMLNSEENKGFRPMTNKEHYEASINHPDYGFEGTDISYSGASILNTDDILKDWSSRFAGIGYTGSSDGFYSIKSNSPQINAVKQSIKGGLSSQEQDAMLGLYLSKNGGQYDKKQYEKWFNGVIDDIAAGKKIFEEDYRIPTDNSGSGKKASADSSDQLGMPYFVQETSQVTGERDDWWLTSGFGTSHIGLVSSGRSSYEPEKPRYENLTGNAYKLSDESGATLADNQVSPDKSYGSKQIWGKTNYVVMPEFTGQEIIIKDGKTDGDKPRVRQSGDYKAGMLISPDFHGEHVTGGVKKDIAYDSEGNPYEYSYVVTETGGEEGEVRALVHNYGRKVVSELDKEGELTGHKYISDLSYEDSFRYLQGDFARTKDMSKIGYNNGALTAAGKKAIMDIQRQQVTQASQLAVAIQRNPRDPRNSTMKEQYDLAKAKNIILTDFINGKKTGAESGIDPEFIQNVLAHYTSPQGLQRMMDEAYYELVRANTNRPKASFTQNTGNIEGY